VCACCSCVYPERLTVTFSRSSGPGGQNVNKRELACPRGTYACTSAHNVWLCYASGMHYGLAVNTKVEVRFHVQSADWIPKRVKRRVESMVRCCCCLQDVCIWMKFIIVITSVYPTLVHLQYRNRITKSGELVITSQRHRTQRKNLEDAVLRLDGILSEASELPKGPSQLTVARIKAL